MEKKSKKKLKESLQLELSKEFIPIRNILQGITNRSKEMEKLNFIEKRFDDLYKLITSKALLVQAYGNIQRNKGSMTRGTDQETIDNMSLNKIEKLIEKLKTHDFKFSRSRRIYFEKPKIYKPGEKKKLRPITIPNFEDRIIQEAIRIILEAIYEPVFEKHNYNYGFRPNKSPHNTISDIKYQGTGSTYAIEGDIKGAYDNVDHNILYKILEKRIQDKYFLELLYQGFKSGILENYHKFDTLIGVPQGGLASPILFNIYMQEFDNYIHHNLGMFIEIQNKIENRMKKAPNKEYNALQTRLDRLRRKYNEIKGEDKWINLSNEKKIERITIANNLRNMSMERFKRSSILARNNLLRIRYFRYADDWIILTNGTREFAEKIKIRIENWLKTNLKLELSPEKTLITNLKKGSAKFLGFSIRTYTKRKLEKNSYGEFVKLAGWNIIIDIDLKRINDRLFLKRFINHKKKPIAKNPWSVLREEEIINRYNYMLRGFANYYFPMIDRLTNINYYFYILKFSCMGTLAKKFDTKITKIKERFGDPLTIRIEEIQKPRITKEGLEERKKVKNFTLLTYAELKNKLYIKRDWKKKQPIQFVESDIFRPMETINWRTMRNLTNQCVICGAYDNVEMHHIKHIKKGKVIGFAQVMKQLNRTMIPLCKTHHQQVHKGLYDSIRLEDLVQIERFLL